eukprot:CAMPEP_0174828478 /NCGR_PEP_ID=MMETSP1114-20130205/1358_1 /TAXON_ID=312471 /ORGANISM="Neobodo designis, Strain CCAP 1951/1" /LENGTH=86 /DNA_ID=CAMNT_0016062199 /DNA_START=51 /DNA_END=311 /DNA_ORIENTATION=+
MSDQPLVTLTVRGPEMDETTVDAGLNDSVRVVREKVAAAMATSYDRVKLVAAGHLLDDGTTLNDNDVADGTQVQVLVMSKSPKPDA